MTRPAISVVISAYTEARWTELVAAVASVQNQTYPAREIIVVIDHNHALFEQCRIHIPGVIVIENQQTRGLSGARNSGIAAAQGDVIAFLDDDARAMPDWLAQLAPAYAAAEVVGAGGAIEPAFAAGRPHWFPDEFDWVIGCTWRGMSADNAPVRNLIGCNMSFRREAFAAVGGFRNGVGQVGDSMLRCDETDFCIRLHQHSPGKTLLYKATAKVYHQVPASRTQWSYYRTRCYTEGLAKGLLAQAVGARDGLASERSYALRVLPQGVMRGLTDTIVRRDLDGLARASAIVAGLALTTLGYVRGSLSSRFKRDPTWEHSDTDPVSRNPDRLSI